MQRRGPRRLASIALERVPSPVLVGAIALAHRRFEPELAAIDAVIGSRRRTALDVGAWYGPWTVALASRFEHVVAIEPNPAVARRLRSALPHRATLESFAASDRRGGAVLVTPTGVGAEGIATVGGHIDDVPGTEKVVVRTDTIDSLGLGQVDFVKVDVEGHELQVLTGALSTIARSQPIVLVELEQHRAPVQPVLDLFATLGYRPAIVRGGRLDLIDLGSFTPAPPSSRSYVAEVVRPDRWVPPNNVVFLPSSAPAGARA